MCCLCGHNSTFHAELVRYAHYEQDFGACEECDECPKFSLDPSWEPPDPPGWEGGFADNH